MIRVTAGAFVRPIAGETVCGDACLIEACARGVLVAAVDGLGHGPPAAAASKAFLECIRGGRDEPLPALFASAHRALLRTRGVVAVVARFDEAAGTVEAAGLGNVTTLIGPGGSSAKHVVMPAGVVGGAFRTIRPEVLEFAPGDHLILHTDGVRSRFDWRALRCPSPAALARAIVDEHGKSSDDAGCVVVIGTTSDPPPRRSEPASLDALEIAIRAHGDAEFCAAQTRAFADHHGFSVKSQWEVAIAVSELATNVLKFAVEGTLVVRYERGDRQRIVVEVADGGPGIADVALAASDRFSEGAVLVPNRPRRPGQGLGIGLGCVYRMMDRVTIETSPSGTRVIACKYGR